MARLRIGLCVLLLHPVALGTSLEVQKWVLLSALSLGFTASLWVALPALLLALPWTLVPLRVLIPPGQCVLSHSSDPVFAVCRGPFSVDGALT